jgi:predicted HTH domain antitoxin
MYKTKFFGVRMEREVYDMIEQITKEEGLDKTSAIKMLIQEGWREFRLKKTLDKYKQGLLSVDNAAKLVGLTVNEMMREIASNNIKSEETIEEYRKGVRILAGLHKKTKITS